MISISTVNNKIQRYVADHGEDLPGHLLEMLSDLDLWVRALEEAAEFPWAVYVVGVSRFESEGKRYGRVSSETIFAPYTHEESMQVAEQIRAKIPDALRIVVQPVEDHNELVTLDELEAEEH